MRTISVVAVLLILALAVIMASPQAMAYATTVCDQVSTFDGTIDEGITQDTGPPCGNYFANSYAFTTAEAGALTTAMIVNARYSDQSTAGKAQTINSQVRNNYTNRDNAKGVAATARNGDMYFCGSIHFRLSAIAEATGIWKEAAHFAPDLTVSSFASQHLSA